MGRSEPDQAARQGPEAATSSKRRQAPGQAADASAERRELNRLAYVYPAHSDGVVCRCAVRWRREALARGLTGDPG